jgi:S1-C subfamily serine protease
VEQDASWVVCSAHVLGRKDEGFVDDAEGEKHAAKVLGRDATTDLALLRVDGTLPVLERASKELKVGHLVLALGRLGARTSAVMGMVSALDGAWRSAGGGRIDRYIDVDTALPAGFSGGALVDATGKLIGVNTHGLTRGGTTLPSETVDRVLAHLEEHGSVRRGWLGVGVQPVRLSERVAKSAGHPVGLLVTSLADGGPAEQASLHVGDVITTVDGVAVSRFHDLLGALSGAAGRTLALVVVRADQVVDVEVTAGDRPARPRQGAKSKFVEN